MYSANVEIKSRTFKDFFTDPVLGNAFRIVHEDGTKEPYHRVELYTYPGMSTPFKDTEDHELGHLLGQIEGCSKPWCLQYETGSEILDKFGWVFLSSWMWPVYRLFTSGRKRCPACEAKMPK